MCVPILSLLGAGTDGSRAECQLALILAHRRNQLRTQLVSTARAIPWIRAHGARTLMLGCDRGGRRWPAELLRCGDGAPPRLVLLSVSYRDTAVIGLRQLRPGGVAVGCQAGNALPCAISEP